MREKKDLNRIIVYSDAFEAYSIISQYAAIIYKRPNFNQSVSNIFFIIT